MEVHAGVLAMEVDDFVLTTLALLKPITDTTASTLRLLYNILYVNCELLKRQTADAAGDIKFNRDVWYCHEKQPVPAPFIPVYVRDNEQVYYYINFDAVVRLVFRQEEDSTWLVEVEAVLQQADDDVPFV